MPEYINREELQGLKQGVELGIIVSLEDAVEYCKRIPAADVVHVVRCKDCKHSRFPSKLTQTYGIPGVLTCTNKGGPCNRRNVFGDGFCDRGEQREGAE